MRVKHLLCAAGIVAGLAPASFGAITYSSVRETNFNGTGLDRVVLYGIADAASGDIASGDISVTSATPNGLKFAAPAENTSGDLEVPVLTGNVVGATTTRASNVVFRLIAPGFPVPDSTNSANFPAYASGLTSFQIAGLDSRDASTTDIGLKATSAQNNGNGAAILAAIVPTGTTVTFGGSAGGDVVGSPSSPIAVVNEGTPVPEPTALCFLGLAGAGTLLRRRRA